MTTSGILVASEDPDMNEELKLECYEEEEEVPPKLNKKKVKTSQWCSAKNCKNGRYGNPGMSFFRFPRDEERCRKWVENCDRQDLICKSAKELFKSNVLCELHFEDSQFTNPKTRNRLRHLIALPTQFSIPTTVPHPLPPSPPSPSPPSPSPPSPSPPPKPEPVSTDPPKQTPGPSSLDLKLVKLRRRVDAQRKCIDKLERFLSPGRTQEEELTTLKSLSAKYLRPDVYEFFCTQLDMSVGENKQNWSANNKFRALAIYSTSPMTYRLLQKIFYLPSISSMRRMMGKLNNLHQ